MMKSDSLHGFGICTIALLLAFAIVSCGKKSDPNDAAKAGSGERTGIAVDTAPANTVEITEGPANKAVIKTGENTQ